MSQSDHNAAVYFASDAFDPGKHGLNGRRVAGESFLAGYLRHMGEGPLVACFDSEREARAARSLIQRHSPGRGLQLIASHSQQMETVGTMFYPALSLATRAWARMIRGPAKWSLCGITHTTATRSSMDQIAQMAFAPMAEWDALICTSRAVKASVDWQLDLADDYLRRRFGPLARNPRPMTEVIPLGIDTAAFVPDRAAGNALRARLQIPEGEILGMVLSRLTIWAKFDPVPLFMAFQRAASQLGQRLHLALVGRMELGTKPEYFTQAADLMPDVTLHMLDGLDAEVRSGAFAAADIFLFPIDNVQETFGIAPVEAMAAGVPVIATDWDGLRDTVTSDVGFRVPTVTGDRNHSRLDSLRYLLATDSELQFQGQLASMTGFDIEAMAGHIVTLAHDPDLRQRMGMAGQRRARECYDWSVVIPQMQALWARQNALRAAVTPEDRDRYAGVEIPVLPSGFATFQSWPSRQVQAGRLMMVANPDPDLPSLDDLWYHRRITELGRELEPKPLIAAVLEAAREVAVPVSSQELRDRLGLPLASVERSMLFLVKYDLLRLA